MTTTELLTEAQPIATRVARSVVRHFAGYIEAEDIVQDLVLWCLEHEDKAREYLEPTDDDPKCIVGRRKMHTTFRRRARGLANEAKAERLGYSVRDLHFYSAASIEELLPTAMNYTAWLPSGQAPEGPKAKSDPALGNDLLAMLCDIRGAYLSASMEDQELLGRRFLDTPPVDADRLALEYGVTRTTIDRRVDRALGRILWRLGGPRPTFTGRNAITNRQAQRLTHEQMEGTR